MSYAQYNDNPFLLFFAENETNSIEKLKVAAFLYAISDIFVIDSAKNFKSYNLLLHLAQKRLSGDNLFKARVEILRLFGCTKKISNEVFKFQYSISNFSSRENEKKTNEQIDYLMNKYSLLPTR